MAVLENNTLGLLDMVTTHKVSLNVITPLLIQLKAKVYDTLDAFHKTVAAYGN